MPVDLQTYAKEMDSLNQKSGEILRQFRDRMRTRDTMQELAVPLTNEQSNALVRDQLSDTQSLQSILSAAIAAIDPNQ